MVLGTTKIFKWLPVLWVKKWKLTSELAEFNAIMFTGTFGPLLWEKFYPVKGSHQTVEIERQWLSKRTKWQLAIYPIRCHVFARYSWHFAGIILKNSVQLLPHYGRKWSNLSDTAPPGCTYCMACTSYTSLCFHLRQLGCPHKPLACSMWLLYKPPKFEPWQQHYYSAGHINQLRLPHLLYNVHALQCHNCV